MISDKRLCLFEGLHYHKWRPVKIYPYLICSLCGVYHSEPNPDYSTFPDDRERLWGYLMGKEEMWRYFQDWTCDVWEENVDLVERGLSWNTEADRIAWLFLPLDGVPRWVSLLSEWLQLDSTIRRFGYEQGELTVEAAWDDGDWGTGKCTVLSEWAKYVKEGK